MTTPKEQPVALPARMSLIEGSLTDFTVAILPFPFMKAVSDFQTGIEQTVHRGKRKEGAAWRELNNLLAACAPTLTYGFEWAGADEQSDTPARRALAVGTPNNPFQPPDPTSIHHMIRIWVWEWVNKHSTHNAAKDLCDRFLDAIERVPAGWDWQIVPVEMLISDISAQNGLGYHAIPSLLATLLHGRRCVLQGGDSEQEIRWRKVQGNSARPTGLYLASQPFHALYSDRYGKLREGYFAYRLDFHVETQAGRFREAGTLHPWIFMHVSCQRYSHENLIRGNFNRDLSVLVGLDTPRLPGCPIDSTLVRLVMDNGGRKAWKHQLPRLLTEIKARTLAAPEAILSDPAAFGNLDNTETWDKDVYRLVHAEGYKYGEDENDRGHGHSIKTGYALRERGEVIAHVLELLGGTLSPDGPLECDVPAPLGSKAPLVFRDHGWLSGEPVRRNKYPHAIDAAIQRAMRGETVHLYVLWHEPDTREFVEEQLRNAFLLRDEDVFPSQIAISYKFIEDGALLEPLETGGSTSATRDEIEKQMQQQREQKKQAWHRFLKQVLPVRAVSPFVIVEIGRMRQEGVSPKQSIYGVVREACALAGADSQMVQTVTDSDKGQFRIAGTQGRVRNAVLDITHRHIGVLYGLPGDLYRAAKIRKGVAHDMDVVALCRRRTTSWQKDIHYALAVRLCADGAVEVLLPEAETWIPYVHASVAVGQLFSQARRDQFDSANRRLGQRDANGRLRSRIKLSGNQLAQFAAQVLTQSLDRPTLALIEADVWRNERSVDEEGRIWPQLKNEHLWGKRDVLDFSHLPGHMCEYERTDPNLDLLLAVIRLRKGQETPQYITNRVAWNQDHGARDFQHLSGFWDTSVPELLHYFSIGRLPKTQQKQDDTQGLGVYKLDRITKPRFDEYGADISYKHPQMVEMVPFFVRPDFKSEVDTRSLCRAAHYLRSSPASMMGNLVVPYPMHLGNALIDDHLCILDIES